MGGMINELGNVYDRLTVIEKVEPSITRTGTRCFAVVFVVIILLFQDVDYAEAKQEVVVVSEKIKYVKDI